MCEILIMENGEIESGYWFPTDAEGVKRKADAERSVGELGRRLSGDEIEKKYPSGNPGRGTSRVVTKMMGKKE